MLVLTLVMYSLSTVHIALSFRQNLIAFFDQHAADGGLSILNDQGNPIVYTQIAVEVINVSMGLYLHVRYHAYRLRCSYLVSYWCMWLPCSTIFVLTVEPRTRSWPGGRGYSGDETGASLFPQYCA